MMISEIRSKRRIALQQALAALIVLLGFLQAGTALGSSATSTRDENSPQSGEPDAAFAQGNRQLFLPLVRRPIGPLPAFPGAAGFGAESIGGRGGRIIEVTNLNDSGPGSLRAAAEAEGPRIVVFRVAGTITLQSSIEITEPYLTIAGQTAPGGGITLRGPENGNFALLKLANKRVHDIVIRYIRLRVGKNSAETGNNLTINYGSNVIVDHVSFEWSNDHHVAFVPAPNGTPVQNVTIQRSILAQALWPHSTAMLLKLYDGAPEIRGISIHHNLFAHNSHRNPRIRSAKQVEVVNNVIYNWNGKVGSTVSGAETDLVGNYLKAGPWGSQPRWYHYPYDLEESGQPSTSHPDPSLYVENNLASEAALADPWELIQVYPNDTPPPDQWRRQSRVAQGPLPVRVEQPEAAYSSITGDVGANARLDCRGNWVSILDVVDEAILRDVTNGTGPASGEEVDHQDDFGGYPAIPPGTPCADSDHDGMPDEWEDVQGLNPGDPSDGPADDDSDGYTNVEEYLNGTTP